MRPGWPETNTNSLSLRARLAPFQVMLDLGRLVVLVDAEEADVEIVARILEVVRVAAVKGDLLLRGEDQPDVGVLFEAIKVILPALVERDHVAAQAGLVERFLLDLGHDGAAGREGLSALHVRLDRRLDALGHVLDAHQDVEFQIVALVFVGPGPGVEAVAVVIVLLVADLLQASAPTW